MRVMVIPVVSGALRMVPKVLEEKSRGIRSQRKNQDHQITAPL